MMTAVWKAPIAQKAQKISNGYLAVGDGVLDVPYNKVKNRGCCTQATSPYFIPKTIKFSSAD